MGVFMCMHANLSVFFNVLLTVHHDISVQ